MHNLLFIGPPGAGKGTQAKLIADRLSLVHLATGDLLRDALKRETPLGLEAQGYMDAGNLVPDELVLSIVDAYLAEQAGERGVLFDGFPRTLVQAQGLDQRLEARGRQLDKVIYFELGDDPIVARIVGRRTCPGCGAPYHVEFNPPKAEGICDVCGTGLQQRPDDNEAKVRTRLGAYHADTAPLLDYYRGKGLLESLDASQPIEAVSAALDALVAA